MNDTRVKPDRTSPGTPTPLPLICKPLLRWFTWYSRRYLRRHFQSVRLSCSGPTPRSISGPLVIYSNHVSWWDPLVCLLLAEHLFGGRVSFAPIDAQSLERYRFFRKLGFFGVEQGTRRGAAAFLRTARAVLSDPNHILWMTPQGRFVDPREPSRFKSGLAHLAELQGCPGLAGVPAPVSQILNSAAAQDGKGCPEPVFLPLAIEYPFWEDRRPHVLARFGTPLPAADLRAVLKTTDRTKTLEAALCSAQAALAAEAIARDSTRFESLLEGRSSIFWIYDCWSFLRSRLSRWQVPPLAIKGSPAR